MRRSPLLVLSTILIAGADPSADRFVFVAADRQSIFGDDIAVVRVPVTVAEALGGSVSSISPLLFFASTL